MEGTREREPAKESPPDDRVEGAAATGSAPAPARGDRPKVEVRLATSPTRCPYCHDDIPLDLGNWVVCKACLARHHVACWGESKQCATCSNKGCLRAVPDHKTKAFRRSMYSVLGDRKVLTGEDAGQNVYKILATMTGSIAYAAVRFQFLWLLVTIPFVWIAILLMELKQRQKHEALLRKALEHRRETDRAAQGDSGW